MASVYQNRRATATSVLEVEESMTADPKARAMAELARAYERAMGIEPQIWICEAADGVRLLPAS